MDPGFYSQRIGTFSTSWLIAPGLFKRVVLRSPRISMGEDLKNSKNIFVTIWCFAGTLNEGHISSKSHGI